MKPRNGCEEELQSEELAADKRSVLAPEHSGCEHYFTKTGI